MFCARANYFRIAKKYMYMYLQNASESISEHLFCKTFLGGGGMPSDPPSRDMLKHALHVDAKLWNSPANLKILYEPLARTSNNQLHNTVPPPPPPLQLKTDTDLLFCFLCIDYLLLLQVDLVAHNADHDVISQHSP